MDCQRFPSLAFKAFFYWQLFWHRLPYSLCPTERFLFYKWTAVNCTEPCKPDSLIPMNLVSNYSVHLIARVERSWKPFFTHLVFFFFSMSDEVIHEHTIFWPSSNRSLHMKDVSFFLGSLHVWRKVSGESHISLHRSEFLEIVESGAQVVEWLWVHATYTADPGSNPSRRNFAVSHFLSTYCQKRCLCLERNL